MAQLSSVPAQTKGGLLPEESEITLPGEQWADIASLAGRRCHLRWFDLARVANARKTLSRQVRHRVDGGLEVYPPDAAQLCALRNVKMNDLEHYTTITAVTLEDMAGLGDLSQLLSMWFDRRKTDALPARASFDPLDMRKLLGRIVIMNVLAEPLRFRFRLVGTDWVTRFGFDPTNTFVEDFPRVQSRAFIQEVMSKVVQERVPSMVRRSVIIEDRQFRYGMLLLPLASDGHSVDMIMIGFDFPNS